MNTLQITVDKKIATYNERSGTIVCGNSDYQIQFSFDKEWEAHKKKTARFEWGGKYYDVEFEDDTCPEKKKLINKDIERMFTPSKIC